MLHRPPITTLFPYTTLFRSITTTLKVAFVLTSSANNGGNIMSEIVEGNPATCGICGRETTVQFVTDREGGKARSEEHTSELQSQSNLVCRLLLEKKKTKYHN